MKSKIFVIGHRNPDTDSICSAIAYANFKNQIEEGSDTYIPKRAGAINEETKYVLKKFSISPPSYITDVATQIRDVDIRRTRGVKRTITLKKAWSLMRELDVKTLPVLRSRRLEGIITTEDIAKAYMDVYDNHILATAHTKFSNIIETLDGTLVTGEKELYYTEGKVVIAASDTESMKDLVEEKDLVIVSNRKDTQECAIKMGATCIVVCGGDLVEEDIKKLAAENQVIVITTQYDTFTVARLINQSMPISYFMNRDNLVTFRQEDFTEDVKSTISKMRYRYFPILNYKGEYIGLMSRRNLSNVNKKKIILVDHNELSQAVEGLEDAQLLEIIDHHRLGSLETLTPIYFRNQPLGCTATIIYEMFKEKDIDIPINIAGILLGAIISDTLMYRSPTCTSVDRNAAEKLAEIAQINVEEFASEMFRAGSDLHEKSDEEIFYQDFKKFTVEGVNFGIGQITSMTQSDLEGVKDRIREYMNSYVLGDGLENVYFMLTNILEETTELIYVGNKAEQLISEAFDISSEDEQFILKGVVSRKKQLLPQVMTAIQS